MYEFTLLGGSVLVCLITLTSLIIYMNRNFNYWKNQGVPFVKPKPIFGNILDVLRMKTPFVQFCKDVYNKSSSPYMGIFMLDRPGLLVRDLDLIKDILVKDFDYFIDRTIASNEKHDIMGSNMLFIMKTPNWNFVRRKVTPIFTTSKIKFMSELTTKCAEQMIEYISKKTTSSAVLDARDLCVKYASNSITSTFFGLEAGCFEENESPFSFVSQRIYNWKRFSAVFQTLCFYFVPYFVKIFRMRFIDTMSSNYLRDIFWQTMNDREKNAIVRGDLLDILIEMRKQNKNDEIESLNEDVIFAQAVQFFAAGFETTSTAMTFALLELARHSDIQNKLRKEIKNVKEKHGSISYNSLQDMEYLEKVVLETLRMYPIFPFLDRRCMKNYKNVQSNLTLQEGDLVYIPVMAIHYDEKYYPDPNTFDPDRFNTEEIKKRHNMSFLAFGEGPRYCIGRGFAMLNMQCGLAHLIMNYEIKKCERTVNGNCLNPRGMALQPGEEIYLEFVRTE